MIYGLSYPNGHFFSYGLTRKRFADHGPVATALIPGEQFEREKAIGRALAIANDGTVFTSGQGGQLYRFKLGTQKLERLETALPAVPGRAVYNRVDSWAGEQWNGFLYGGTSDGSLFRLDPKLLLLEDLGRPLSTSRIRGLAFSRDGKLYGCAGDDGDMARMFRYDPERGNYTVLGMLDVSHRPYYAWQAYVVDALIAGKDGTLYIGQSERHSKLYLYHP